MLYLINHTVKKALMFILNSTDDSYQIFRRIGMHLVMKILFLFIYLFIYFGDYLCTFSSWILPGIISKWIRFTVFFPKEFEITGRRTFLVRRFLLRIFQKTIKNIFAWKKWLRKKVTSGNLVIEKKKVPYLAKLA